MDAIWAKFSYQEYSLCRDWFQSPVQTEQIF